MKFSLFIRKSHRWLSIAFTALVLANIVINITGLGGESLALAIGLTTLVPLILLMISGLYLFALPYLGSGRRQTAAE
ncbi:MAG: hypothetical protein VX529_09320 [Pseudomonadota bacterium]|jgi:hypothetical protein|nr:hypothetical protein [Pseudomonadota bacterium]